VVTPSGSFQHSEVGAIDASRTRFTSSGRDETLDPRGIDQVRIQREIELVIAPPAIASATSARSISIGWPTNSLSEG
jgi:hypothetical protein